MPHIVTIGEILVDVMAGETGQTFSQPAQWHGPYPGGAPAVFISQAARLGVSAGIIACVGDDDFGRLCTGRLRADGVDTSAVSISKDVATSCAFVAYREDGGRSFIFHMGNAAAGQIRTESVREEWLADCRYLHVMGSSLSIPGVFEAFEKAARLTRKHGGKISFDPNIRPELLAQDPAMRGRIMAVYRQSDLLLPGADELALLTGRDNPDESIEAVFRDTPAEHMVIKMGARGCRYAGRSGGFCIPPFRVAEVDPTGAGDSFGGTLVAALTLGLDMREAVPLAAAAGAVSVTRNGAMEGARSIDELRAFVGAQAQG